MVGGTEKRAQTNGDVDVIRTKEKSFCIAVDGDDGYSEFWRYTAGFMTTEKGNRPNATQGIFIYTYYLKE